MDLQVTSKQGQLIPIQIKRSLKSHRLRLSFDSKKMEVSLTLPPLVSSRFANRFLKEKENWIERQWNKAQKIKEQFPDHTYQDGDVFFYLGERLILEIKISPRALQKRHAKRACKVMGDRLEVALPPGLSQNDQLFKTKEFVEAFYKQKASEIIHDRLQYLNEHYQFTYHRVTFRNQKTRWGSCSAKKNLNFNWRLVMAPIEVIDYVVIHELCHLKEMNHSASFWSLVSELASEHKQRRRWLKENGDGLVV